MPGASYAKRVVSRQRFGSTSCLIPIDADDLKSTISREILATLPDHRDLRSYKIRKNE
jgi:hypothetical protein